MNNSLKPYVLSAVASVVLLSVGTTSLQAFGECGPIVAGVVTCNGSSYTTGINYYTVGSSPISPALFQLNNSSMAVSTNGVHIGNDQYRQDDIVIQADAFSSINTNSAGTMGAGLSAISAGNVTINVNGGSIVTTGGMSGGTRAVGVEAVAVGTSPSGKGEAIATLQNTSVTTYGLEAYGVQASNGYASSSNAKASIDISNSTVRTFGTGALGVGGSLHTASNASDLKYIFS